MSPATPPPGRGGGLLGCGVRVGPGVLNGNGIGLGFLANNLSQMVQRIVVVRKQLIVKQ